MQRKGQLREGLRGKEADELQSSAGASQQGESPETRAKLDEATGMLQGEELFATRSLGKGQH